MIFICKQYLQQKVIQIYNRSNIIEIVLEEARDEMLDFHRTCSLYMWLASLSVSFGVNWPVLNLSQTANIQDWSDLGLCFMCENLC